MNLLRLLLGPSTDGVRTLLNLLCLLLFYFIILLLLFSKLNRIFEGLNMLEKSRNFAHSPRSGENLHLIWVSKVGVVKWLDSATYTLSTVCASSYVSRTCMKIGTTHVTHQYLPKSLLKQIPNPTGSWYLKFSWQFCVIFDVSGLIL